MRSNEYRPTSRTDVVVAPLGLSSIFSLKDQDVIFAGQYESPKGAEAVLFNATISSVAVFESGIKADAQLYLKHRPEMIEVSCAPDESSTEGAWKCVISMTFRSSGHDYEYLGRLYLR